MAVKMNVMIQQNLQTGELICILLIKSHTEQIKQIVCFQGNVAVPPLKINIPKGANNYDIFITFQLSRVGFQWLHLMDTLTSLAQQRAAQAYYIAMKVTH